MTKRQLAFIRSYICVGFLTCSLLVARAQTDPLPSWNDSAPKKAILAFVEKVTKEGTSDFVSIEQRIATFDNDGTLWVEQPMYVQMMFVLDRVKELAPKHPEWKTTQPFKAVLDGDMKTVAASGEKGLLELMAATHSGVTVEQFQKIVTDWLATARSAPVLANAMRPSRSRTMIASLELASTPRVNAASVSSAS